MRPFCVLALKGVFVRRDSGLAVALPSRTAPATATDPRAEPGAVDMILAEALAARAAVDRDPGSGLSLAERAARHAAEAAHPTAAATAETAWGHALLHVGDLDDAARHLRRAMAWGARASSPELMAWARYKLAFAILQQGRPQTALRQIDAALPDLHGSEAARAHAQRGIVLHVIGRLDEAQGEFDVALRAMRRQADLLGVQRMLVNRALVHADRHAYGSAEDDLLEAESLARQLGRSLTIGLIANNLGLMETLRGDVPAALRHLDRAEAIIGAHGAQLGTLHQDQAQLLLSVGLVAEAEAAAADAIEAYRRENRMLKDPDGGRARHRRMGRLVQPPPTPRRDRPHPTRRIRSQLLPSDHETPAHSHQLSPPPNPGRFNQRLGVPEAGHTWIQLQTLDTAPPSHDHHDAAVHKR